LPARKASAFGKFLTQIHDEVLDHHGEVANFASLLRCCCLIYTSRSAASSVPFYPAVGGAFETAE